MSMKYWRGSEWITNDFSLFKFKQRRRGHYLKWNVVDEFGWVKIQ